MALLSSCNSRQEPAAEVVYFEEPAQHDESPDWATWFHDGARIALQPPGENPEAFEIAKLLLTRSGNLAIPDFKNRRVFFFSPVGDFIQAVGKQSEGRGEFGLLRTLALDPEDNLYVFDLNDHRIHVFDSPDYRFSGSFSLGTYVSSFFISPAGEILAYYPTDKDVVKKFDSQGNLLAATFRPARRDIATFLSRIQIGGITGLPGGGVLLIYPGDFVIYEYDADLNLKRELRSKAPSKWRTRMPDFPDSLSPKSQGPEHKKWWDTHLHIGAIHRLGKDLLAVTVYRTEGDNPRIWFLNLYTLQGRVLAEGLAVPDGGRIVGAGDGLIFIATEPALTEEGSIRASRLTMYRLRQDAGTADEAGLQ